MSKRTFLLRYLTIIKKLRSSGEVSFDEIKKYLERESEMLDVDLAISKRTFLRDLNDIRELFNLDIQIDSQNRYKIIEEIGTDISIRTLEAFDLFNSLSFANNMALHIQFETRRPQGTEHINGLLHAIKNRYVIQFDYQKFWEDKPIQRKVEPYSLKESQGRWYFIGMDSKDNKLKTFGLDRMTNFFIDREKFSIPKNFSVKDIFKDCFGIINLENAKTEIVVLSFVPEQGKYIRTLPIHESQKILADTDDEFRIELKLKISFDLIREIMSHGNEVKVLSPKKLQADICKIYSSALSQYK